MLSLIVLCRWIYLSALCFRYLRLREWFKSSNWIFPTCPNSNASCNLFHPHRRQSVQHVVSLTIMASLFVSSGLASIVAATPGSRSINSIAPCVITLHRVHMLLCWTLPWSLVATVDILELCRAGAKNTTTTVPYEVEPEVDSCCRRYEAGSGREGEYDVWADHTRSVWCTT